MTFEGGCYCGKIRYVSEGEPRLKAQCHCRECQYISGGSPNMFMLMPPDGFRYVSGTPKTFARSLRDMRHAHRHAAARPEGGGPEGRNAR